MCRYAKCGQSQDNIQYLEEKNNNPRDEDLLCFTIRIECKRTICCNKNKSRRFYIGKCTNEYHIILHFIQT